MDGGEVKKTSSWVFLFLQFHSHRPPFIKMLSNGPVTQSLNGVHCCFQMSFMTFQYFRRILSPFYFSTPSCKELKILSCVLSIWVQVSHKSKYTYSLFKVHCHANRRLCIANWVTAFCPRSLSESCVGLICSVLKSSAAVFLLKRV